MKILYVTTVGITMGFFKPLIKDLIDEGHTIDIATNELGGEFPVPECYRRLGCKVYPMPWTRSPKDKGNIKAIKELHQLVADNGYDIVHCHTPIASVCTRIACKPLRKNGLKVIYTAHGFHFFDGAPVKNWLAFYPVEKHFSRYTDVLVTITKEDYNRANEKFKAKKTVYIPGVGIDTANFAQNKSAREKIRAEVGLSAERTLLLSVGELNVNKNHSSVIKAIAGMENITYVIVGQGQLKDSLSQLADESHVDLRLMGFRNDAADFYDAADIYILPSLREGLNVSLMEAMASSLPCLAGNIRGNVDLIDEQGGILFEPASVEDIKKAIVKELSLPVDSRQVQGNYNSNIIQAFDLKNVKDMIRQIYQEI